MKRVLIIALLVVGIGVAVVATQYRVAMSTPTGGPTANGHQAPAPNPRATFEAKLKRRGMVLAMKELTPDKGETAAIYALTPELLRSHKLYFVSNTDNTDFVYVTTEDDAITLPADKRLVLKNAGELIEANGDRSLVLDGEVVQRDLSRSNIFWITNAPESLKLTKTAVRTARVVDGFMRKKLLNDDWSVVSGSWKLKKYGGGMPTTEKELESYNFQRAVNPFSVRGSGVLRHGERDWLNAQATASFYFGKPWEGGRVEKNALPANLELKMGIGQADGELITFGWDGALKSFVSQRRVDGKWELLHQRIGPRPPISNWVRIGVRIRAGSVIEGLLDGKVVSTVRLKHKFAGKFYVLGGPDVEFDDFSAATLPLPMSLGGALYVKSKNFSAKKEKTKSDPVEFRKWAKGASAFVRAKDETDDGRYAKAVILSRTPLMADFLYESIVHDDAVGDLPMGLYELELLTNPSDGLPVYKDMQVVVRKRFLYSEDGWFEADSKQMDVGEPVIRLSREATKGNKIFVTLNGKFTPISYRVDDPLHIAICRLLPKNGKIEYPRPEHHRVVSKNLRNEFFESTPTEWNWIDGGFRMDCRWACMDQWNFMACGSDAVPMIVSKHRYDGDQEHEFFASLRPMFPSDAGDREFDYDSKIHRRFFKYFNGWYNRHDINFSFCMDGRNPMSGYTVIYGGNDNEETRLLRKGQVVASTNSKLFPATTNALAVHWRWWNFNVRKYKQRILVYLGDNLLFDYHDPEPLGGGHIAFWTVRNGFTLAKIVSTAQVMERVPDVLYVDQPASQSKWKARVRDSVRIEKNEKTGMTRVTANVGCGQMAVRRVLLPPKLLSRTPIMHLPINVPAGTQVNIFLYIDERSRMIRINAPLERTKVLLTPQFEPSFNPTIRSNNDLLKEMKKNEFFNLLNIPPKMLEERYILATAQPRGVVELNILDELRKRGYKDSGLLRSITIGNSSNKGYLLAGNGGNKAGAYYEVGEPVFSAPTGE